MRKVYHVSDELSVPTQLLTARAKGGMSQSWSLSLPSWLMSCSVTGTGGPLGDPVSLEKNIKELDSQGRKPYQGR